MAYYKKKYSADATKIITRVPRFEPEKGWSPQFEACFDHVVDSDDNLAVSAVAGSGKTTCAVEMLYQYKEAYPYNSALYIAFNSHVREEAKSRVPYGVDVETCHSFNFKALIREWGDGKNNFDIQGSSGPYPMSLAAAAIGQEEDKLDDRLALCQAVSMAKTRLANNANEIIEMMDQFGIESTYTQKEFSKHILWMLKEMMKGPGTTTIKMKGGKSFTKKAITYDDQVWVPIIKRFAPFRLYDLVIVDECQDLSPARLKVAMNCVKGDGKIIALGDQFQCISTDTMIETAYGQTKAIDLKIGDKILSWRCKKITQQTVKNIIESYWKKGLEITTSSGKKLLMSPNHKIWASDLYGIKEHIVYLMYRKDLGFRVGTTNKAADKYNPYGARTRHECADKLWILEKFDTLDEALLGEEWYSLHYGIPTSVFRGESRGLNQKKIDLIFKEFGHNGWKLLSERNISFDLPHWHASGIHTDSVSRDVVRMCAHNKECSVVFEWTGYDIDFQDLNVTVRKARDGKNAKNRKRVTKYITNYRDALKFATKLANVTGSFLSRKLYTPEDTLRLLTAGSLIVGQKVPVLNDDKKSIHLEDIISIEEKPGTFVDLDVDDASNFFGNGILSHNSCYAFAGADINAMPDLIKTIKAKQLPLTCSFRCAKNIIKEAQKYNPDIEWAPGATDGIVRTMHKDDLVNDCKPGDVILSRTNAPLVKLFFNLAKSGKKVSMLGKDFGAMIAYRIRGWKKEAKKDKEQFTLDLLLEKNDEWLDEKLKLAKEKKFGTARIEDEHEIVVSLSEGIVAKRNTEKAADEILERLQVMFSEDETPGSDKYINCVTLSSTHKFKGLERDKVYILTNTYRPGEGGQELNLMYIAVTRAKKELVYVVNKE